MIRWQIKVGSREAAEEDSLWNIIGIADTGLTDLAERHDEYLAETIAPENR